MKLAAAAAALLATLAMPALAQHGGARGGFGGHAVGASHIGFSSHSSFGGGFHGGFAPRSSSFAQRPGAFSPRYGNFAPRSGFAPRNSFAPHRWAGASPYRFAQRPSSSMNRMRYRADSGSALRRGGYSGNHHGRDHDHDHHHHFDHDRMPYGGFGGYSYSYAYAYPYWSYPIVLNPWLFGPDSYDTEDNSAPAGYGQNAAPASSASNEAPPAPYTDYAQSSYPEDDAYAAHRKPARPRYARADAVSPAAPQQSVTLIFKNGRASEKIQNYMLTASTLTVFDPQYQQIPIDQIDVSATEATNRSKGIDFQVPPAGQ